MLDVISCSALLVRLFIQAPTVHITNSALASCWWQSIRHHHRQFCHALYSPFMALVSPLARTDKMGFSCTVFYVFVPVLWSIIAPSISLGSFQQVRLMTAATEHKIDFKNSHLFSTKWQQWTEACQITVDIKLLFNSGFIVISGFLFWKKLILLHWIYNYIYYIEERKRGKREERDRERYVVWISFWNKFSAPC